MTPEDRALMLAQVGVPTALSDLLSPEPAENVLGTPDIQAMVEDGKKKAKSKKEASNTGASTLEQIIAKAGPNKDLAMKLCDEAAQAHFDADKITKIEAARRGLADRELHNKPLWAEAQKMRETLKSGVRKHYEQRTVAAKVKATGKIAQEKREKVDDEALDKFLASEAFSTLFAKFRESQKAQEG